MVLRSMNLCKPARCLFVTTWTSSDVNLPFWGDDIEYVFWIYHWSIAAIFLLYKKQTARKSFPLSVSYIWLTFQAIQINQNFQSRISIFTNLARVKLIFPWNPRSFSKMFSRLKINISIIQNILHLGQSKGKEIRKTCLIIESVSFSWSNCVEKHGTEKYESLQAS